MRETGVLATTLMLALAQAAGAQDTLSTRLAGEPGGARDPFVGTFVGQNVVGPVTVEIVRDGEGYVVVDRSATPMRGEARVADDGVLRGEYVAKIFGFTRRHKFELTPEAAGLRYKIPGATITIERYARTDDAPESRQWLEVIGGARLAYLDRYSSGTSGGYTSESNIYLCSDGNFQFASSSSTSLSGDGISASSNSQDGGRGTWRIRTRMGRSGLELRFSDGRIKEYQLEYRENAVFLDGKRWLRGDNTACP